MTSEPGKDDISPVDDAQARLNQVMRARRSKLAKIRELGVNPYPYRFPRTHPVGELLKRFDELSGSTERVRIAGRLMSIRVMGKAAFAHLQDEADRVQVYFKRDIVGADDWECFKLLDIGDIIGAEGELFLTRTGERTLKVRSFVLLSKNLRPFPAVKEKEDEVWFRWTDKEERYRNRPIDLVLNRDSRRVFEQRSRIITEMRRFFDEQGFLEVETPVLQPLYGGAAAKPFVTRYNALDQRFYLRIADELYLKRLITGGFNRVYEISKDFRNEGIDRLHSPEFTMLECYVAFEDYNFCVGLLESLLPRLAESVLGGSTLRWPVGGEIDLTPPFHRTTMAEIIRRRCGVEIVGRRRDELAEEVATCGVEIKREWGTGKLIDELFSKLVQPELVQPTFIFDYPEELSPLAKSHRDREGLVERFELFIGGVEIANAFSELNDPGDQRRRFEVQREMREGGDEEAHPVDEDFLKSLELGMPPAAGLGVGVDRLVMLLTGAYSIRDVILFPALRRRED